jgi:hypothetical protein
VKQREICMPRDANAQIGDMITARPKGKFAAVEH